MSEHEWSEGLDAQTCKVCGSERKVRLSYSGYYVLGWVYWAADGSRYEEEPPCEPDDGSHAIAESITSD